MRIILILLLYIISFQALSQVFVDDDASGAGNGSSWADAFTDLSVALNESPEHTEFWIAEGIYVPHNGISRDSSFTPKSGMKLFGGFSGSETEKSQRDPDLYETIISGEAGAEDTAGNINVLFYIYDKPDTLIIDGFTITEAVNNKLFTSTITIGHANLKLRNCDIVNNTISGKGVGAGGVKADTSYLEVENCSFRNNTARGARNLYLHKSLLSLKNSSFSGNKTGQSGSGNAMIHVGDPDGETIVENCTFTNNELGEIYIYNKNITFRNCHFKGNDAQGLLLYTNGGPLLMENCHFENNRVAGSGSGYLVQFTNGTFRNSIFENNNASALFSTGDSTKVYSCDFTDNRPDNHTSGVISTGFLEARDSDFINNHAGGTGYSLYTYDSCRLKNCNFIGNGVEGVTMNAGAVYFNNLKADSCLFKNNYAKIGGALLGNFADIRSCTFDGNTATRASSSVQAIDSLYMEQCLFINNSFEMPNEDFTGGGGIVFGSGGLAAINCAFIDNNAGPAPVLFAPVGNENNLVTNCTFFNNYGSPGSESVSIDIQEGVKVRNTILWDDIPGFSYPGAADVAYSILKEEKEGNGNLTGMPQLDAEFRLQSASPAIDAGAPQSSTNWPVLSVDINGESRIVNDRVDIGASEYQNPSGFSTGLKSRTTRAFPNPVRTSGQLHVFVGIPGTRKVITVNDISGRAVAEFTTKQDQLSFESPSENGIYFYTVQYEGGKSASGKIYVSDK